MKMVVDGASGRVLGCHMVGADAPEITARFTDPYGNLLGLYQEPSGR